jgi:two-component system, cell cycle sensor histidine kinase and response regulator CckA
MRQAIDTSGDVIFMTDADGVITFVNREFERLYGYTPEDVVGRMTPRILRSGQTSEQDYAQFWGGLMTGRVMRAEFVNRTKGGALVHMEGSANPILDDAGEIAGYLAVQRDVTARQQAEQGLRDSEARYRTLAETARDQIFIIGKGFRIEYLNAASAELLQRDPEGVTGLRIRDCFPHAIAREFEQEIDQVRKNNSPLYVEREMVFPKGNAWQGTWLAPIDDGAGTAVRVMGISRDITDRKRLAALLERQNQLLSAIVNNSPVGVAVLSGKSFICDSANPALQLLRTDRKMVGLPFADFWPGDTADVLAMFDRVLTTGITSECVDVPLDDRPCANGSTRTSVTITASLLQSSATPTSILAIFTDTTARKQLEAQFYQSQKMEAVGRLAGGVAHDFNNLLTSILGYAELLKDTFEAGDSRIADLAEIQRAGESAATLTRHLLAFSRKQIAQPAIIDLNDALSQFQRIIRRTIGEDIQVSLQLDPRVDRIRMDAGQLEQILMNLSVNARDAMARGGRLTIQTSRVVLEHPKQTVPAGRYAMLAVTDTGVGMTPEVQTHLFEPFFTTKEFGKGTGLGLSTVYGIVKQNEGHIVVSSEVGQGTTFMIYLPALARTAASEHDEEAVQPLPQGDETILIAEDSEGLRTLAVRTLEGCGYRAFAANDAAEALRIARAHDGPIDLLLTDVVMPGADGLELSRIVAAERPETRILYMSGHTDDVISHHGLLERGVQFLQKPFNRDGLARRVRDVLDDHPMPTGSDGSGQKTRDK